MARPLVKTLIPTFPIHSVSLCTHNAETVSEYLPIAYAVFPRKNLEYIGGDTTMILPLQPLLLKYGSEACMLAYRPSGLILCIN